MECIVDTKDLITFTFVLLFVSQMLSFQIFKTGEKIKPIHFTEDFPGGSDSKESAYNAGDPGLIPGSGRSPGEGNGNALQLLLPGKFRGWSSLVGYCPWGHKESDMTE